jgi:hypothetical protein
MDDDEDVSFTRAFFQGFGGVLDLSGRALAPQRTPIELVWNQLFDVTDTEPREANGSPAPGEGSAQVEQQILREVQEGRLPLELDSETVRTQPEAQAIYVALGRLIDIRKTAEDLKRELPQEVHGEVDSVVESSANLFNKSLIHLVSIELRIHGSSSVNKTRTQKQAESEKDKIPKFRGNHPGRTNS